jgi:hypothetical protein
VAAAPGRGGRSGDSAAAGSSHHASVFQFDSDSGSDSDSDNGGCLGEEEASGGGGGSPAMMAGAARAALRLGGRLASAVSAELEKAARAAARAAAAAADAAADAADAEAMMKSFDQQRAPGNNPFVLSCIEQASFGQAGEHLPHSPGQLRRRQALGRAPI